MIFLVLFHHLVSPVINGNILQSNNQQAVDYDTEYWAVIVGISDYEGIRNDLPVSQRHLKLLYDVLVSQKNWQEDHISLLINEEANRDNILEALDWLHDTVDQNDVVLFSFQGHGSSTEDNDGDESDGKDEGIVAWEGLAGLITDDELDEKFNSINCSGMMLIFHSCLSGGLIDISQARKRLDGMEKFTTAFTTDLEGQNRIIVMSSMDQGLALAFPSLTRQISYGLQGNADDDVVGDPGYHIVTAEEAAIYGINQVKKSFILLFLFCPPAIISFLFASVIAKIRSGYWILPVPQLYDGYEGELPIAESV